MRVIPIILRSANPELEIIISEGDEELLTNSLPKSMNMGEAKIVCGENLGVSGCGKVRMGRYSI